MMKLRYLILLPTMIGLVGCSKLPSFDEVLPDKRTAYRKSKDLPNLEVPPDLTVTEGEYRATIPGEAESTTLSEFERQRDQRAKRGNVVLGSGQSQDEQWLALQGDATEIWPRLRQFWAEQGYDMDLDDAELGVMETAWKAQDSNRERYRIFSEPDEKGGLILFISSERQTLAGGDWLESSPDEKADKETLRLMNLHFYGKALSDSTYAATEATSSGSSAVASKPRAEILDLGDGKIYLAMPQEFTRAWRNTETIILRAGYVIQDKDQEKGTYNFLYFKPEEEKEEGLLSKLKFWGDDEDEGIAYQLSLTGVGDKTEAIVMNKDGEWETGDDARNILDTLQGIYNRL